MKIKLVYVFIGFVLLFMLLHEGCASNNEKKQATESQYTICESGLVKAARDF